MWKNKNRFVGQLNIVFLSSFLWACSSQPVKVNLKSYSEGLWKVRVDIQSKDKDQSLSFRALVQSQKEKSFRMDILGPLGSVEATLLSQGSKTLLILWGERKVYKKKSYKRRFFENTGFFISPLWLSRIFWKNPVSFSKWRCDLERDQLKTCSWSRKLEIQWRSDFFQVQTLRRIVDVHIERFKPKVQEDFSQIEIPEGFSTFP